MSVVQSTTTPSGCKTCGKPTAWDIRRKAPFKFCSPECQQSYRIPLIDRFILKTRKMPSGCIEWQASKNGGYGQIAKLVRCEPEPAHRVSYELFIGPIPEGLWVLHKCDNRPCVNPGHLFLGTHQDNMDDCRSKQRNPKGSGHGRSVLDESCINAIRQRIDAGELLRTVAADYGVSRENIYRIANRKTWRHVPELKVQS